MAPAYVDRGHEYWPDVKARRIGQENERLYAEKEQLRAFLNHEVLPRYMEMFMAAGLGEWRESVIYQRAIALLG